MTIQYIKDEEGKDQYVVIPYSDYFRMRLALLEYDDEDESDWEDIPYESDIYDNVMLPGEVCDVMHKENVSLQAAWRSTAVSRSRSASICRKRVNSTSPRPCRRSGRPGVRGKMLRKSLASDPDG